MADLLGSKDTQGILCKSDRTFYYLETGNMSQRNNIDRLRGILLTRDLIKYHRTDVNDRTPPYKIITLDEAKEKGIEIKVIYISKHVESVIKAQEKKQAPRTNPWNR